MDENEKTVLSKQQIAVLDDLFGGQMGEEDVLRKHKVGCQLYRKWLNDDAFADQLEFRMESLQRQGRLMVAKLAPYAAVKLVELMDSDKVEIVRKACLDAKSLPAGSAASEGNKSERTKDTAGQLDSELAGRLLDILAEGK